jgi:hypothetical protein
LALVLLAAACTRRPPSPVVPEVAAPTTMPSVTPAPSPVVAKAVAAANAPVQLLPEGTAVIVNAAGIGALLAVIDIEALLFKVRPLYEQASAYMTSTFGANLLDPGQWSQIGVDPKGPIGVAVVDVPSATVVVYATISESERLRAFLDKVASPQRLLPVYEDRGVVLRSEDEDSPSLVLRDGFAFLVITEWRDAMTHDIARQLASMDPAVGLTATPRYQQAIAGGTPGAGLTAYLDLSAILGSEEQRLVGKVTTPEQSWSEQELEAALARGAAAEDIDRLRQQIASERDWQRRSVEKRLRSIEFGKRWLAGVSPVVFEFTGSLSGLVGTIRAKMPETAPLRAVLRNASEPSPVLMALGERPALMFGGSVDMPVALAEFEAMLRAGGEDPDRAYRELGEFLRIPEPRREILTLLTGTGGFALTLSDARVRGEQRGDASGLGFALGLGVRETARAEALLDAAWKRIPGKVGTDRATGAHMLEDAGQPTIYAKVVAQQIVVTTDAGLLQRLATGTARSTLKWLEPPVVPVVSARDAAMQGFLDPIMVMSMLTSRYAEYYDSEDKEPAPPYWMFPDVPREKFDKVPRSAAYKARMREWQVLATKLRKYNQARARSEAQRMLELARCVGALVGNLREQPDGVVLAGGQLFGKGGLARAIDLAVNTTTQQPMNDPELNELMTTRAQLLTEMHGLRARDVAMALKVPVPAY